MGGGAACAPNALKLHLLALGTAGTWQGHGPALIVTVPPQPRHPGPCPQCHILVSHPWCHSPGPCPRCQILVSHPWAVSLVSQRRCHIAASHPWAMSPVSHHGVTSLVSHPSVTSRDWALRCHVHDVSVSPGHHSVSFSAMSPLSQPGDISVLCHPCVTAWG